MSNVSSGIEALSPFIDRISDCSGTGTGKTNLLNGRNITMFHSDAREHKCRTVKLRVVFSMHNRSLRRRETKIVDC